MNKTQTYLESFRSASKYIIICGRDTLQLVQSRMIKGTIRFYLKCLTMLAQQNELIYDTVNYIVVIPSAYKNSPLIIMC